MQAVLKYALNTANMRFHLQTHHHHKYAAVESQERARLASSGSSTSAGSNRMQPTLVESFKISNTPSTHITLWQLLSVIDHQLIALVFFCVALYIFMELQFH